MFIVKSQQNLYFALCNTLRNAAAFIGWQRGNDHRILAAQNAVDRFDLVLAQCLNAG